MIFLDSSDLGEIVKWKPIISGVTTNPVILAKENVFDIPSHIQKIIDILGDDIPISIEVPDSTMTADEMVRVGCDYWGRFENIVVKVPMNPLEPEKAFSVIRRLEGIRIKTNATIGMSFGQMVGAVESGATYVSLFWGRREEVAGDAGKVLSMTADYINKRNYKSKIIVGSIRYPSQIDDAFNLGADIVTIPPKILKEWFYTKRGVETVEEFDKAYRDIKDKITSI
jgi:transaldolase